ncbi:major facilitator superfamily domain-containing protein [Aspergillus welwitschiae]|uniref:Major facilitator superfamily domain-containing protein n=1 Tax=Aspergillus welwitschiae TaxID=1341132 RepID=A0A3F3PX25_9EURO|nr:major facilitator superfamily domain-containing protein [Aspergillus welwitschiae]RDH31467.1 major facilitator superfamily domain-containing protein [Aspergillus welwitschiae]
MEKAPDDEERDREPTVFGAHPVDSPLSNASPARLEYTYPEGGRRAWLAVAGAWCCNFSSFGWTSSIGVFQAYYSEHQLSSYSSSSVSWIPSANLFMLIVLAPVFGKIFDNYGPRYAVILGACAHILGLVFLSLSTEYYQMFLSQSILSGIGACSLFYSGINAVSTYFKRRKALANGIVASGSSLGGVILPIMFDYLIADGLSFGWTIRAIALTFLILLSFASFVTTSNLKHQPKPVSLLSFVRPFKELKFVLLALAAFFTFWGVFIPINYIVVYAKSLGMSSIFSNYQLVALNAASVLARVGCGFIGDRYGCFNTIIINVVIVIVSIFVLWFIDTPGTTMAFSIVFGWGSGSFISLLPACIARISDIREIGVRVGMIYFVSAFACLTGNPISGALIQGTNYRWMQVFAVLVIFVGLSFFVALRMVQSRSLMKVV